MAYIFHENELPSLISEVPGRERIFFINQELANIDDMLAGVMHYKNGAVSLCVPKIRFCNIGGEGRQERDVM